MSGKNVHAFDEIVAILDYVPMGYSLDSNPDGQDDLDDEIESQDFDDDDDTTVELGDDDQNWDE